MLFELNFSFFFIQWWAERFHLLALKRRKFIRNESTSSSFLTLWRQTFISLNALMNVCVDFFAANPSIVSCRPHARRPIHCYHPNNVHHIHSLPSTVNLCPTLLYCRGPLICRAHARLWPTVSCCDVFLQCWKQEEVQTRRQESEPWVEPDCHL